MSWFSKHLLKEIPERVEDIATPDKVKDVLLKAAEDISAQGVWCFGAWFKELDADGDASEWEPEDFDSMFAARSVEEIGQMERCAEGSIYYAGWLMGHGILIAEEAIRAVDKRLSVSPTPACGLSGHNQNNRAALMSHNDSCLYGPGITPLSAGQDLSELFRATAENL